MRGLQTVSVVDALTSSLRERVLDGAIDPGRGLTEQDLASEYEVSRPTARSAITHLVADGLLRREAHKPAYVPVLSQADVRDLFLVRTPLELEVVRVLAGTRTAPADAGKAVGDLAAIGPERPHSAFVEADLGFHRALVAAVGSARLSRVYQALSGEIHLSMVQSRHALGRERIVAEHCGVLGAIEAGDAERAMTLMRSHLDGACAALADKLAGMPSRAAELIEP
jgi:DNA-binding GntR family transcriptional regulator